ncbi:hypothetical protein SAMN05661080_04135 [Modestobacter sp. DSM 44400]|uniref:hypothetical protein n=1 Tax=Modestobacter sp. DSM 44400 TaxID=1550230 RepID=UPI00089D5D23|nr:hypothetical protein [Modestobacter sp. DSM 44400]SDY63977.1 hypothetical protein SAMN05661080_04135 [Modestobacter sp. DSM 44400]
MSSPFQTVTSPADELTHLVLHSPAMPGHRPEELPRATLCGGRSSGWHASSPGEVGCLTCLYSAPQFMALPGFWVIR